MALFTLPAVARGQTTDLRSLDLPRWTLGAEDLKLGSIDGEHDAFVQISQVRTDEQGRIYVLDVRLPALRIFDRTGRFIRQIGATGDGPGEYRFPGPFGFLGDTIWIAEARTGRITLFDSTGTLLATRTVGTRREQIFPFGVLGEDAFLVLSPWGPPDVSRLDVGRVFVDQSIERRNGAGEVLDTIVTYRTEPGLLITGAGGNSMIAYAPFHTLPLVQYRPDTRDILEVRRPVATSRDSGVFRITVRTEAGDVVRDRRFVYRPFPVPASVRDTVHANVLRRLEGMPQAEKVSDVVLEHLEVPRFLPPVSAIRHAPDGTIWIQRESHADIAGGKYLVLDGELNPVATVELPANTRIAAMGRDHLWLVTKDEFDVQYLERHPLRRN